MEISALTRSVVKRRHAVISPDGYINSRVPGWDNCTVNVIINEQMGANLCQTLITMTDNGKLTGTTVSVATVFLRHQRSVYGYGTGGDADADDRAVCIYPHWHRLPD